jgi:hypothetical protein
LGQQQLEWHVLTAQDCELYRQFYTLLKRDGAQEFSSDTFRKYGLHKQIKDKQHGIGTLFAKWKWHRLIVEVGRKRSTVESNNQRRISVFKFKIAKEASA